jgi:cytochrome c553
MKLNSGIMLLAALVGASLVAACGDDDEPSKSGTGGSAGATTGGAAGSSGSSGSGGVSGSGAASGTGGASDDSGAAGEGGTAGEGGAAGEGGTAGEGGAAGSGGAAGALQGDMYKGGLVWDNWTKTDAGGSGLPSGYDSTKTDFIRCKSCHGWDAMGKEGGYVRRTSSATRPAPIATISNLESKLSSVTDDMVWHTNGHDWTVFNDQMPKFDQADGLTAQQVADVVAYLKTGPKVQNVATLDITPTPVAYTFTNPDTTAGATAYVTACQSCHGTDGKAMAATVILGEYFSQDGKYSEAFHKIVYGVPNTSMLRTAMGSLTQEQARDILAYIQDNIPGVFPTN